MSKEPIAQLAHSLIGRTKVVGRTELGIPIEESIPSLRGVTQYDRDGNRLHTPTHSHRAFIPSLDEKVRPRVKRDLLEEGYLEEGICPHLPREDARGKLVAPVPAPEGVTPCDGVGAVDEDGVGGCKHLKGIVRERRRLSAAKAADRKRASRSGGAFQMPAMGQFPPELITAIAAQVVAMMMGGAVQLPGMPMPAAAPGVPAPTPDAVAAARLAEGAGALKAARTRNKTTVGEVDAPSTPTTEG